MERKILFVASTFSHIRNFHCPYLREFARRGWQTDIACGGQELVIPEARRSIHIPLEKSMISPKNFAAARLLRREILAEGYSLISCHTALASFFVRLAVMGMKGRPLVVCISHGYLFDDDTSAAKRLLLAGAEKLTAPVTDLLMTMNGWDTQYAQKHRLGKAVRYIPGMGVDFSRMDPYLLGTDDTLRTELGFGPEHFLLVYAAEFSARKNQSTLLHALTRLPEQVVLLLPGSGTLLEECKALAQHLGVAHRVVFPGHIFEMPRWYAAADAAVASSRIEGLPFNVMEAMYCGLPVVASSVKGHIDLIEHERTGLLFPYGDHESCALQIQRLLDDSELSLRLGQAARHETEKYQLDLVFPQIMEAYDALLPTYQPEQTPV